MAIIVTKFRVLTPLTEFVYGVILLDKNQKPIGGGPLAGGPWFPAIGDKLEIIYRPETVKVSKD